jgi:hypothetical protein
MNLEILNLPEISNLLIFYNFNIPEYNNILKCIYNKYILFNVNLYYQSDIYKKNYFEYFFINIIIKINNNINIDKLKIISHNIKKYLLTQTNIIYDKNYKKIIDYINITNIFYYLYNKFKNNDDIRFIFKYYFHLLKNKLDTVPKIDNNNNNYNDILNYYYIYNLLNKKKLKYNIKISDIKNEVNNIINNYIIKLLKKIKLLNENKNEINYLYYIINNLKKKTSIFNQTKIININKLKKIFLKKKIEKIKNKNNFIFIKFKETNNKYMLIGGTNNPVNDTLNNTEITEIKKDLERKINEKKNEILQVGNNNKSGNIIALGYELIKLQTKYEYINNLLINPTKIKSAILLPIPSVDPTIKIYKDIYKCITKKKINNKINYDDIDNDNDNNYNPITYNEDKILLEPTLDSYKLNYKCILNKKKYLSYLSDFEEKKITLESKINAISNEDNLFDENIIQNITKNIKYNVYNMTSLKGILKQKLINKIDEIIDIDIKINKNFKKMVIDITNIVKDINSDFMSNAITSFKKKLIQLQKNLFLFQVRTIFSKFTQITNIMTQNLDPIYNKHNDEKLILFKNVKSLVDIIDNKIVKMNEYINEVPNQNKINKYSIETDSNGNISMKSEEVEMNKLKNEDLLYIQSMNTLSNNPNKTLDLGINQELTKYESLYKSSKIIYDKNLERYIDSKSKIDAQKEFFDNTDENDFFNKYILAAELYKFYDDYLLIQEQLINSIKNYNEHINQYIALIEKLQIDGRYKNINIDDLKIKKIEINEDITKYICKINKDYYLQKNIKEKQKNYFKKYKKSIPKENYLTSTGKYEDETNFLQEMEDTVNFTQPISSPQYPIQQYPNQLPQYPNQQPQYPNQQQQYPNQQQQYPNQRQNYSDQYINLKIKYFYLDGVYKEFITSDTEILNNLIKLNNILFDIIANNTHNKDFDLLYENLYKNIETNLVSNNTILNEIHNLQQRITQLNLLEKQLLTVETTNAQTLNPQTPNPPRSSLSQTLIFFGQSKQQPKQKTQEPQPPINTLEQINIIKNDIENKKKYNSEIEKKIKQLISKLNDIDIKKKQIHDYAIERSLTETISRKKNNTGFTIKLEQVIDKQPLDELPPPPPPPRPPPPPPPQTAPPQTAPPPNELLPPPPPPRPASPAQSQTKTPAQIQIQKQRQTDMIKHINQIYERVYKKYNEFINYITIENNLIQNYNPYNNIPENQNLDEIKRTILNLDDQINIEINNYITNIIDKFKELYLKNNIQNIGLYNNINAFAVDFNTHKHDPNSKKTNLLSVNMGSDSNQLKQYESYKTKLITNIKLILKGIKFINDELIRLTQPQQQQQPQPVGEIPNFENLLQKLKKIEIEKEEKSPDIKNYETNDDDLNLDEKKINDKIMYYLMMINILFKDFNKPYVQKKRIAKKIIEHINDLIKKIKDNTTYQNEILNYKELINNLIKDKKL